MSIDQRVCVAKVAIAKPLPPYQCTHKNPIVKPAYDELQRQMEEAKWAATDCTALINDLRVRAEVTPPDESGVCYFVLTAFRSGEYN